MVSVRRSTLCFDRTWSERMDRSSASVLARAVNPQAPAPAFLQECVYKSFPFGIERFRRLPSMRLVVAGTGEVGRAGGALPQHRIARPTGRGCEGCSSAAIHVWAVPPLALVVRPDTIARASRVVLVWNVTNLSVANRSRRGLDELAEPI